MAHGARINVDAQALVATRRRLLQHHLELPPAFGVLTFRLPERRSIAMIAQGAVLDEVNAAAFRAFWPFIGNRFQSAPLHAFRFGFITHNSLFARGKEADELQGNDYSDGRRGFVTKPRRQDTLGDFVRGAQQGDRTEGQGRPVQEDRARQI